MSSSREVERKVEAAEATPVPARLGDEYAVEAAEVLPLDATYYDTAHLRLLRHGATMRYRVGDDEPGWHLKVAAGPDAREEIHAAGEPGTPPAELLALVRAHAGREAVAPVAELRTTRLQRGVVDGTGRRVASLDDDEVSGTRSSDGLVVAWRELEAELGRGTDDALLDVLAGALGEAGWKPSAGISKIGRVLCGGTDPRDLPSAPTKSKAARRLLAHLDAQVSEIVARDVAVRAGDGDSVHKMRVATRRLRSALATFRPCFVSEVTDPLRDELKWLGAVLGGLRDDQVLHARLNAAVDEVPELLVLGPVRERVRIEMRGREQEDLGKVVEALDTDRYVELMDGLHRLVEAPPWTDDHEPDGKALRRGAQRAIKRVEQHRPKKAEKATDAELHELRKAAKRARYALEMLGDDHAARFEAVQELLGDHQDSIGARAVLRLLGAAAPGRSETGVTFGLLHPVEEQRAAVARASWPKLVRKALKTEV